MVGDQFSFNQLIDKLTNCGTPKSDNDKHMQVGNVLIPKA